MRRTALIVGILYLVTFVSIPTGFLYADIHDPQFLMSDGPDAPIVIGGYLEIIVGLAAIGTAVALYPVLKKQNETVALGFVGARTLEAALIFVGVASLWSLVGLRQAGVGAEGALMGLTLATFYERAFLVSQALIPAVNALLLGSLLYQARLVPRILPVLGLIGAPLLIGVNVAISLGLVERLAPIAALPVVPIALWELSLGVYLVVKGFRPSPPTTSSKSSEASPGP